jgi:hypothetical protein
MRFEWPIYPSAAGAASYLVYTQCGEILNGTSNIASVTFYEHCVPTDVHLLVVAYLGGYVAYRTATIPFVANGTPPPLAGGWTALTTSTVSFTAVPPELSYVELMYRNVVAGTFFRTQTGFSEAGTTASVMPQRAPGFGDSTDLTLVISPDSADQLQLQVRRLAGNPATADVAIGPSLLPWVGATTVDVAARSVTATVTGTGDWDLSRFWLRWTRMVDGEYLDYDWVVYAPGGTTGLTLAELPESLAPYGPATTDGVYATSVLVEVDTMTGAQVRQLPDEVFGDEYCDRWNDWSGTSWRYFESPPFTARYSGVPPGD